MSRFSVPSLTGFAVSHWWDDPFSRGAWSLLRVGGSPKTRTLLGTPVSARVIFAGEATNPEQAGMTHGAYEEGQRAARWALSQNHRRVVVIGAGIAGLGSARLLHDSGVDVVVVEGRSRIGGRIHSVDVSNDRGEPVVAELGANWLQQGNRNTLVPLAEKLSARLVPTNFNKPLDFDTNGPCHIEHRDEITDEFRRRLSFNDPGNDPGNDPFKEANTEDDRSVAAVVQDWMEKPKPWSRESIRRVVDSELYLDCGAPLDDLSARFGFEPGVGEGDRWIVGGYRQILDDLAHGLNIVFDCPINAVTSTSNTVTVSGPTLQQNADAVIVTVPIAVLRHGDITFDPALPSAHKSALDLLTAGRVEKVILRFAERWWPVSLSGYLRTFGNDTGSVAEWLDLTDVLGTPAITGLFVGPWLEELWDGHTDQEIAERAARLLKTFA